MSNNNIQQTPRSTTPHPVLPEYFTDEAQRRSFVRQIFDETAADYDRIERLTAFGSGAWYRHQALLRAGLAKGMRVLDVATGTGLVAREAVSIVGDPRLVTGYDLSAGMLAQLRNSLQIPAVQGRGEALPFADHQFDFLSVGYALRHFSDLNGVFREFRRVLKPGGRVLLLEMTVPESGMVRQLLKLQVRYVAPVLSKLFGRHGDMSKLYRYFWDTCESCVPPEKILAAMADAQLSDALRYVDLGVFSEYRANA